MPGVTIKIFLADGTPNGLKVIEKANWIGRGLVFQRPDWVRVRARSDFERPGVYVLFGRGDDGIAQAYVGEADELRKRISQHYASFGFWERAVAFVSRDQDLNKAHVRYLESHMIARGNAAKRSQLINGTAPPVPQLSETDEADADAFLQDILLILPLVGVDTFMPAEAKPAAQPVLHLRGRGAEATGYESADGFTVRSGSLAAGSEVPSVHEYLRKLRIKLVESGVLVPDGNRLRFAQDYAFNSPSTASGVVLGRTSNGRADWKDSARRTLAELQAATAEAIEK